MSKDQKTCCVCDDPIPPQEPYKLGILSVEAAAGLMDMKDLRLLPACTRLADGRVQMNFCLDCARTMPATENVKIRYNS